MSTPSTENEHVPAPYMTLHEATRRYRLLDPSMKNSEIAQILELIHSIGDFMGMPDCCFFTEDGCLVAIRTGEDEVSIFHVFQGVQARIENIATRMP